MRLAAKGRALALIAAALLAMALAVPATAAGGPRTMPMNAPGAVLGTGQPPLGSLSYKPGVVIVGLSGPRRLWPRSVSRAAAGPRVATSEASIPREQIVQLPQGVSVPQAIQGLQGQPGVMYAVPDYVAHESDATPAQWIPDDPGKGRQPGDWQQIQWNFMPGAGVNVPAAWANLRAHGRPGGRGVVVAVLDTGVAYRNWHHFRRSPDFSTTRFTQPYDFVSHNAYPLDRQGHGTFVAGTIAESTGNGIGLTGIAYGSTIMPVRILDANGFGDAVTIARGIRYAVTHGAKVINLSLEFDPSVTARQIPSIMSALQFAHQRGAVVVAASGNEAASEMAYPARAHVVISVGATTKDRCLADYSNGDKGLDLVAPGGGQDATIPSNHNCDPGANLPDIFQLTFNDPAHPDRFSYPGGWYGTSMASPHVAAVAALVIASDVLGRDPSPDRVLARLEATAQHLGTSVPNSEYGYGLVDAGAATAP